MEHSHQSTFINVVLFISPDIWLLSELSTELKVDTSTIRTALDTWIDHGLIHEDSSTTPDTTYILLEKNGDIPASSSRQTALRHGTFFYLELETTSKYYRLNLAVIEETAEPTVSSHHQEAEQMRVYWKFIEGMLTNLGPLPIDRIQSMLKFAPDYTRTVEQLRVFMEAARRENLVSLNNGDWKLNK